jgi:energy-coupling factor transport system ATP-binding protein
MRIIFENTILAAGGFSLRCSETFGEGVHIFRGRVGSGKSTLAAALAGLATPSIGKIRFSQISGKPVLLMQFPEYQVTGKTVREEIVSWKLTGTEDVFRLFGTEASDQDPLTLSRGELRRLELACVFAKNPDVLILDEPYASLDSSVKPVLTHLIENRQGITLIFSHEREHVPADAEHWLLAGGAVSHD